MYKIWDKIFKAFIKSKTIIAGIDRNWQALYNSNKTLETAGLKIETGEKYSNIEKLTIMSYNGCVRIFGNDMAFQLVGGDFGDFEVYVLRDITFKKAFPEFKNCRIRGDFEVFKEAYISGYNCSDSIIYTLSAIHTLGAGIYEWYYHSKSRTFVIEKW